MTFLFCFCNHNCALPVLIEAYFLLILFGIYDDLTKDHVPGLQKYDICMTEQVSGSRRVKIEGRHLAMVPYVMSPVQLGQCVPTTEYRGAIQHLSETGDH